MLFMPHLATRCTANCTSHQRGCLGYDMLAIKFVHVTTQHGSPFIIVCFMTFEIHSHVSGIPLGHVHDSVRDKTGYHLPHIFSDTEGKIQSDEVTEKRKDSHS